MHRLTSGSGHYGVITYAYDADGNRTTKAADAGTSTYAYASGSNRLQSVTGPGASTYNYDADRNVTDDGTDTYQYAMTGHLIGVGSNITYGYNAVGERVLKQVTSGGNTATTLFVYGPSGHLLGRYDGSGTMEREYIWLRNRPVAVVTSAGTYYVQTDQRGAPRTITDSAGATVWQWEPTPFGTGQPMGSFTFNLRYPGQYYDTETGNIYNHARYYDASIGRYLESDPFGLRSDLNLYRYAFDNPMAWSDRLGLQPGWPGMKVMMNTFTNGNRQMTTEQGVATGAAMAQIRQMKLIEEQCLESEFQHQFAYYKSGIPRIFAGPNAANSPGEASKELERKITVSSLVAIMRRKSAQEAASANSMGRDIWNDRAKNVEAAGNMSEIIAVIPVGAYLGAALDAAWATVNSPGHCPCGGP